MNIGLWQEGERGRQTRGQSGSRARRFHLEVFQCEWTERAIFHTMMNASTGDENADHMMLNFVKLLKRGPVHTGKAISILYLLLSAALLRAAQPRQDTLRAWDDYIRSLKLTMVKRASGEASFLELCKTPLAAQRLQRGEVMISNYDPRKVPQGLIHHWIGTMFVPGATIDRVMSVLSNYEHYSTFYSPLIKKSVVLERDGDDAKVNVIAVQKAFSVTAAVETDDLVEVVKLGPTRLYIATDAVRIREIADFGQPKEHPFPEGREPGYVWRSFVLQRIEERDGGVYIELETVALSRGIPAEVRWLIKPLTDELPRRLMLETLNETRTAVEQEAGLSQSEGILVTRSTRNASSGQKREGVSRLVEHTDAD